MNQTEWRINTFQQKVLRQILGPASSLIGELDITGNWQGGLYTARFSRLEDAISRPKLVDVEISGHQGAVSNFSFTAREDDVLLLLWVWMSYTPLMSEQEAL